MTASDDGVIARTQPIDDGLLVVLDGEIDFSRSPTLRVELMQLIQDNAPRRLVIDLSNVDYMDSSGVATLVEAMQMQRKHGHKLILCGMQPKVLSIFQIARLDMVFTICDDADQAVKV